MIQFINRIEQYDMTIQAVWSENLPNNLFLFLQLSFLGGNPDIMSECLKCHKPDKECMEYAIMSHNIDFVTFLMNEHEIPIDVDDCIRYDNIQAFLIHYDQTNDIK
ncbi:hypothetical protein TVAG_273820 [Trichomonas vaginalis G3]|uniref:DUF3447 domain-containing protein n=1 Tax=Trichomonas vaginalis (strain ATCC PRA-98 / G3) TaxID=412133 RepID=A2EI59_TRIV3|nr:fatty-acyl-CoA binding [Trichomonas vaginalis G3]EAY07698.1 hypothetical protein TVAG_273820 [Trichomonas vaginalis G3]KAI5518472.1 fatty-acyl-CoA binding [Trichomonas vaginalis G3]|eukprot:XP_001319921.1 hypothetical protein [Trichomonas vaginalis G3]